MYVVTQQRAEPWGICSKCGFIWRTVTRSWPLNQLVNVTEMCLPFKPQILPQVWHHLGWLSVVNSNLSVIWFQILWLSESKVQQVAPCRRLCLPVPVWQHSPLLQGRMLLFMHCPHQKGMKLWACIRVGRVSAFCFIPRVQLIYTKLQPCFDIYIKYQSSSLDKWVNAIQLVFFSFFALKHLNSFISKSWMYPCRCFCVKEKAAQKMTPTSFTTTTLRWLFSPAFCSPHICLSAWRPAASTT